MTTPSIARELVPRRAARAASPLPDGGFLTRLRGDLGYYAPAQALNTALNLASVAVFTRALDRDGYGAYAFVLSGALAVSELVFGWFAQSALRFWYAKSQTGDGGLTSFLGAILLLFGLLSIGCLAVWPFLGTVLFPNVPAALTWLGFLVAITQCASRLVLARTRALRDLRSFFWYTIIPPAITLAAGTALVVLGGFGPMGLLASVAAGAMVVSLIDVFRNFRSYVPRGLSVDRRTVHELVHYGAPILITSVAGTALLLSDRVLIAHFVNVASAGAYVVAYNMATKIHTLGLVVLAGAVPVLFQDYDSRPAELVGADLSRLVSVFVAFFAPATVGVALVARPLTQILLGSDFHDAADYIIPLMPGVFALGVSGYLTKPFQLASDNRPLIVVSFIAAVPQLLLLFMLLPVFGPVAAAYVTSSSLVLGAGISYVWSKRYLPWKLDWIVWGRIALALLGMCLAVLAIPESGHPAWLLAVRALVGVATYGTVAIALDIVGARVVLGRSLARMRLSAISIW